MEKNEKKDLKKTGVDYLIEQGYKKLSTKTFISDVDLEQFLNKDFEGLGKARALGFIQILEREYDIDLSDLKTEYLDYELSHKVKKPSTLFVERPMKDEKEWKKYLPYVGVLLAIVALIYMFSNLNNDQETTTKMLVERVEENKSIIDEAQKNLEKLDNNQIKILPKEKNLIIPSLFDDENNTDLDKVVLKMIVERNISVGEDNASSEKNTSIPAQETSKEVKISQVKLIKKDEIKKKSTETKIKKKAKNARGEIYISPKKRTWVGVIYLDNYSKKDFLINSKLPLDSSRDQLIVIGHKFFKIYNKKYSVKFRGKGPVRFVYRDGDIMEINRKEFKRLSAGADW